MTKRRPSSRRCAPGSLARSNIDGPRVAEGDTGALTEAAEALEADFEEAQKLAAEAPKPQPGTLGAYFASFPPEERERLRRAFQRALQRAFQRHDERGDAPFASRPSDMSPATGRRQGP